jgi:hypothetical protein
MEQEIDLDKIAEFMNSAPEETNDIDKEEVENTLDYIDTQLATVKEQTKAITTPEEIKQQEHSIEDLTQIALKQMSKIDKKTDEIYDLFYTPLAMRQDRSDASKVALLDSQRIKVEMINALAGLASAKAKLEMAKQKQMTGNTGIYVNTQNGADVGISLSNLWDATKE